MVLLLSATASPSRPTELQAVYQTLEKAVEQTGGPFYLDNCTGTQNWPDRGLYVFFSKDTDIEYDPVSEWQITRVGTVGVSANSSSTLWDRLRQHRGNNRGKYKTGGNHRGSVFRKHVGRAILERDDIGKEYPHWGSPHRSLPDDINTTALRENEHGLEKRVSEYIRSLPFIVIDVPGEPGPKCDRARLEKNIIGLISHARRATPSLMKDSWLGHHSPRAEIHKTGLWNIDYVNAFYSASIVEDLDSYVQQTEEIE